MKNKNVSISILEQLKEANAQFTIQKNIKKTFKIAVPGAAMLEQRIIENCSEPRKIHQNERIWNAFASLKHSKDRIFIFGARTIFQRRADDFSFAGPHRFFDAKSMDFDRSTDRPLEMLKNDRNLLVGCNMFT